MARVLRAEPEQKVARAHNPNDVTCSSRRVSISIRPLLSFGCLRHPDTGAQRR